MITLTISNRLLKFYKDAKLKPDWALQRMIEVNYLVNKLNLHCYYTKMARSS